jgi:ADP-heptose:LPS heptosyltransferase/SAM-dependent methyltransferase
MTDERQARILLPCGIGDVYWSLVKFRAFCKRHDIKLPPKVAIITTTPEARYAGSEFRSIEFLRMVPFVEVDDPPNQEAHPIKPTPKWMHKIYQEMWHGSRTHTRDFLGYDHFLVYNCAITNGIFLEEIDDLECEWDFPMIVSDEQVRFQEDCRRNYGPYVVFLWSFCGGGYSEHHVKEFHPQKIIEATNRFVEESGCTPVFVGSWWDVKHGNDHLRDIIAAVPGSVDLVGKTNIDQLFGVIKGSEMVVGCHCGPTIMATAFRKKTIILWAKSYPLFTPTSLLVIAPPETRETTYWPLYTRGLTVGEFTDKMLALLNREPIRCVCGEASTEKYEHPSYLVNRKGKLVEVDSQFCRCSCGVVRQTDLPFTDRTDYEDYYKSYPPTTARYEAKDWEHDFALAGIRCDSYGISPNNSKRILDVGSGSGAFVHACRGRGQEAYGCEIAEYAYSKSDDFVYKRAFDKVNFPTDHFDLVTCHDVLEHEMHPKRMIDEMFRVTSQGGRCVVDFPNYFSEAGKHHWKSGEHVWYFTAEQLGDLLAASGFSVDKVRKPIESKLVFYCSKPEQERPSILLPPGIGDSYWSLVKMQAFLRREGLSLPDVSIIYPKAKTNDGHKRSFPFLEMFPFLHSTGVAVEGKRLGGNPIWREAYRQQGRTVFKNFCGFDYFLSYNGHLRVGKRLEDIDPDLRCNWHPPMFVSLEQDAYRRKAVAEYGKYIVFYFVFRGVYGYWTKQFSIDEVAGAVNGIVERTGCIPVFVGAAWDSWDREGKEMRALVPRKVDLTGKTSMEQLFGLMRGAQAVIGYPSGLTIMSAVLGQKTMIIWNNYYNRDFFRNSCPPSAWERNYWAGNTDSLTKDRLIDWATEKITERPPAIQKAKVSGDAKRSPIPTVVCVLKSGGDFDESYVVRMRNMLERNLTVPFKFVCFTDLHKIDGCNTVKLVSDVPGWWPKVEVFRSDNIDSQRVVYFDLDTVILDNIDDLLDLDGDFYGLTPWNRANRRKGYFASGIMAWRNGIADCIWSRFTKKVPQDYHGDQAYMSNILARNHIEYESIQSVVPGIYSYKRECRNGLPAGARIICFHGRPRLHEMTEKWVTEAWR